MRQISNHQSETFDKFMRKIEEKDIFYIIVVIKEFSSLFNKNEREKFEESEKNILIKMKKEYENIR